MSGDLTHLGPDGATFDQPLRIDVLRRPVD